jgi:hypothetical protein
MEPFSYLFDSSGFVPRSHCGTGWTYWTILADNLANLAIFGAYIAIPLGLSMMYVKARRMPAFVVELPRWVILSFALFILFCGVSHFWEVVVFQHPWYRFFITWNWLTAIASWVAVYGTFVAIWRLRSLHTDAEYQSLIAQRDTEADKKNKAERLLREEMERKQRQNQKLVKELDELRDVAGRMAHQSDMAETAALIRQKLHNIRNAAQ